MPTHATNEWSRCPAADADVAHWAKMARWTIEEALALSFGKEPSQVFERGPLFETRSSLPERYRKLRELVQRAVAARELSDGFPPASYISWALRNDIELPTGLVDAVRARGEVELDRQDLEAELLNSQKQYAQSREAVRVLETELADTREEVRRLQQEVAAITENKAGNAGRRPLETRERDSLYSILLVGAIRGYKFDPDKRNDASSKIARDLELVGLELSEDTVRNHLKRAAEPLRRNWRVQLGLIAEPQKASGNAGG
jgi:hypothetical protein